MKSYEVNTPAVSVIMPCYNHERFVEEAVRSVWDQTYRSIELILVDDGSADCSREIAAELKAVSPIPMEVVHKKNGGIATAINMGVRRSQGSLIALLASDDRMVNSRVEKQVRELECRPEVGILHTSAFRVDEFGRFLYSMGRTYTPAQGSCLREFMLGEVGVVAPTLMMRRSVIEDVGPFDETLPIEDWPYFLRAAAAGVHFGYLGEDLTCWRRTSGSAGGRTSVVWRSSIKERMKYLRYFDSKDVDRMLTRMYAYEFESALLQRRYSVAQEVLRDARRMSRPLSRMARVGLWSVARNAARSMLPEGAYSFLKRRLA